MLKSDYPGIKAPISVYIVFGASLSLAIITIVSVLWASTAVNDSFSGILKDLSTSQTRLGSINLQQQQATPEYFNQLRRKKRELNLKVPPNPQFSQVVAYFNSILAHHGFRLVTSYSFVEGTGGVYPSFRMDVEFVGQSSRVNSLISEMASSPRFFKLVSSDAIFENDHYRYHWELEFSFREQ